MTLVIDQILECVILTVVLIAYITSQCLFAYCHFVLLLLCIIVFLSRRFGVVPLNT